MRSTLFQELRKLNPHLKKGRVPSDSPYPVKVPLGVARVFAAKTTLPGGLSVAVQ